MCSRRRRNEKRERKGRNSGSTYIVLFHSTQQQLSQAQQNLSEFKTAVDVERGKGGELQQALQDKDKEIFSLKKQLTKANESTILLCSLSLLLFLQVLCAVQRSLEIQHQNLVVELTKLSSDQNNLLQENQVWV